ncbi:MAG TPA: STAS domain-containing protein [bacterium]|nr:STAS domain-containing protein [bacterium]
MLQATFRPEQDVLVVSLAGTATEALANPVPEIMRYVERSPRGLVVNMRGVHYINSAGLSAIIGTFREAHRRGVSLAFCELQPPVLKVFKLARVEIFVPTFDTENQALKFFGIGLGNRTGEAATIPLPRENLLVVEQDLKIADHLRAVLHQVHDSPNYKITFVNDPAEAQTWMRTKRFHVLLLDVSLPRPILEHMILHCRTSYESQVLPIIIVAPDQKFADADYYVRYGADEMLRFPFNPYEASTRIRSVISASKAFDQRATNDGVATTLRIAG